MDYLVKKYGKSRGENLYCSVRGINHDEVEYEREIHSIGNEETYSIPLQTTSELEREFNSLVRIYLSKIDKKQCIFSKYHCKNKIYLF